MDTNAKYLPKEIKIGAQLYKVVAQSEKWHNDTSQYGSVNFTTHEVNVATEGRPLGEILDTLLHETLHVCWFEWNLPTRPKEERAVRGLGTGLAAVYAQNPEYVRAIARLVKEINDVKQ